MNTKIVISSGSREFEAEIYDTPTGRAILDALPILSAANVWGEEIYFGVQAFADLESDAQEEVEVGDLAYWPTMPAFCIFFGPTPVSRQQEPRAASAVNVFGKLLSVDLEELKSVNDRDRIKVTKKVD